MHLWEAIRLAFKSLWANKLKSGFGLAGVFISVTALIAVVTIWEGMNTYMTEKFANTLLGVNTFHLRRRPNVNVGDTPEEQWRAWARRPRITYDDAIAVAEAIKTPVLTAWESQDRATVEYNGRVARDVNLTGATEDYFEIKDFTIASGRAFSAQEARAGLPVVVMGWELADKLFEGIDPIGKEVRIAGIPYRVIGVVAAQGTLFGISLDKFVIAPAISPIKRLVNPPRIVDALVVKADDIPTMEAALAEAQSIMRSRRHLRPGQEDDFTLETSQGVLDFWGKISGILFFAGPLLAGISLVVGGIVIMNIMLMSVAERTREIGIRKALGAKRRDILRQFLVESATVATVGAILGVLMGIAIAVIISSTTWLPATVAPWSVVLGVVVGTGVGVISGVYPATRAARLDPIVALRFE
ncbi:MAG: FtsX-like permease family protein [Gemmatimonadetes bacterium]|nr:FtsX-like permease family protein [Gemmatimonadota bacterium]